MRSRRDWSPLEFWSDPTPGDTAAVSAWQKHLGGSAAWSEERALVLDRVIGTVAAPGWSGLAAEVFATRLAAVRKAATVASVRHSEAAQACGVWAQELYEAQFQADRALTDAEQAEEDIASANASILAVTGEHAALLAALNALAESSPDRVMAQARVGDAALELTSARRRLEDAQERLEEARAAGRRAKADYDRAETVFTRALDAAATGALTHASATDLRTFTTAVGTLTGIEPLGAVDTAATMMLMLRRLTPAELKQLIAADPDLVQRFWDNPPDPTLVAGWWKALTAEARTDLIKNAPEVIGNLPGLPYADRDAANRISYAEAKKMKNLTPEQRNLLEQLKTALKAEGGIPVQLVAFNLRAEPPRVAVGYGNLDTCTTTTWCAPGMNNDADDGFEAWQRAAQNLYAQQSGFGADPGVIAWLGYDTPDWTTVNATGAAKAGAARFAAELDGDAAARAGSTTIAVVAHSYGTTMASVALTMTSASVSSFTMVASAGIDTGVVPDFAMLHADHVYTTAARRDGLAPFGAGIAGRAEPNPEVAGANTRAIGGAQSFSAEGDGDRLAAVDGHGIIGGDGATKASGFANAAPSAGHGYLDVETQSLYNIAATSVGRPDLVDGGLTSTTKAAEDHNAVVDDRNRIRSRFG